MGSFLTCLTNRTNGAVISRGKITISEYSGTLGVEVGLGVPVPVGEDDVDGVADGVGEVEVVADEDGEGVGELVVTKPLTTLTLIGSETSPEPG